MAMGTGLRVALGVAAGAGLGGIGILVLPPLLVPSAPVQGERADQELAAAVESAAPAIVAEVAPPAGAAPDPVEAAPAPAVEVAVASGPAEAGSDPQPAEAAETPPVEELASLDPAAALPAEDAAPPEPDSSASPADGAETAALQADPEAARTVDPTAQTDAAPASAETSGAAAPVAEEAAAAPDLLAPSFDTVRIYTDGTGLVAGRAEPGSRVEVLADGEPVAEAIAESDGAFVAFLSLPPSPNPLAVALRDAEGRTSEETVLLAPAPPPAEEQVAALGPADLPADPPEAPASAAVEGTAQPAASEALANGPAEAPPAETGTSDVAAIEAADPTEDPAAADVASDPEAPTATASTAPALAAAAPDAPPPASPAPEVAADAPGLAVPPASPGQPPVLLSDSDGVRVLQPALEPGAAPDLLATVALDAVTYDGAGEVVVSGRAGGGTVRLYLDNAPVAEVRPDADGRWSTTLTDAPPGVYTLRLDQIDAAGEVTSRIETPFQREERAALATLLEEDRTGQPVVLRVVQPGNSLWAIARDRYDEPMMYVRVFEANRDRIRDPDLIYPGQVFVLPPADTP